MSNPKHAVESRQTASRHGPSLPPYVTQQHSTHLLTRHRSREQTAIGSCNDNDTFFSGTRAVDTYRLLIHAFTFPREQASKQWYHPFATKTTRATYSISTRCASKAEVSKRTSRYALPPTQPSTPRLCPLPCRTPVSKRHMHNPIPGHATTLFPPLGRLTSYSSHSHDARIDPPNSHSAPSAPAAHHRVHSGSPTAPRPRH